MRVEQLEDEIKKKLSTTELVLGLVGLFVGAKIVGWVFNLFS